MQEFLGFRNYQVTLANVEFVEAAIVPMGCLEKKFC